MNRKKKHTKTKKTYYDTIILSQLVRNYYFIDNTAGDLTVCDNHIYVYIYRQDLNVRRVGVDRFTAVLATGQSVVVDDGLHDLVLDLGESLALGLGQEPVDQQEGDQAPGAVYEIVDVYAPLVGDDLVHLEADERYDGERDGRDGAGQAADVRREHLALERGQQRPEPYAVDDGERSDGGEWYPGAQRLEAHPPLVVVQPGDQLESAAPEAREEQQRPAAELVHQVTGDERGAEYQHAQQHGELVRGQRLVGVGVRERGTGVRQHGGHAGQHVGRGDDLHDQERLAAAPGPEQVAHRALVPEVVPGLGLDTHQLTDHDVRFGGRVTVQPRHRLVRLLVVVPEHVVVRRFGYPQARAQERARHQQRIVRERVVRHQRPDAVHVQYAGVQHAVEERAKRAAYTVTGYLADVDGRHSSYDADARALQEPHPVQHADRAAPQHHEPADDVERPGEQQTRFPAHLVHEQPERYRRQKVAQLQHGDHP